MTTDIKKPERPGRLRAMLQALARTKPKVGVTPSAVVHREGRWSLLRYQREDGSHAVFKTPVLLIPSLINRHYVLDLTHEHSMVETLLALGHDVFVIDWGSPGSEDRFVTFDDICDQAIARALRVTCKITDQSQAHVLGYCLGGTLAIIHCAARPERIATLTALAAPVTFSDEGLLSKWVRSETFSVDALVEAFGLVPWQLMQPAFQLMRPTLPLLKAVSLADRAWDNEFVDSFKAVETWGNDNVSLPGEFYRTYIHTLYRQDALVAGRFELSGVPATLESITCPVMAITFEHDNIVPWRSAATLIDRCASEIKEHVHQPGGHVGAVVSKKASKKLWPKLSAFWAAHEANTSR
ncbi:MAG: alpha/beta fold hydrolase [Deltaproteobacteria bacterium]|nr:alpha/beta fold hydrolase [Deltaproteobacteria bacterium]